MSTYRLMDGVAGRPGVGSSGTQPPSSPIGYSGNFIAGIVFQVTTGNLWFAGYWWWVPPGGDTGPQKFALWGCSGTGTGTLISGSVVTSGALTAGQFNYVPLPAPVQLAIGTPYVAATGWVAVNGFPDTQQQFGSFDSGPYQAGIANGPLYAFSDSTNGGTAPSSPDGTAQGVFTTSGSDPSLVMPAAGSNSSNFWLDVQVSNVVPAGYSGSYRIWPAKFDVGLIGAVDAAANYVLATEFSLSQKCALNKLWFYSPPTVAQLPTQCAIWNAGTQTMVAGTLKTSPAWSGAAGSGWVSSAYSGVTLPAGDYKTSVWNGAASPAGFNAYTVGYFTTGAGAGGIVSGPITAPGEAAASSPGQSTYATSSGSFAYPDLYVGGEGQSYWVDVEVTPIVVTTPPAAPAAVPAFLTMSL